MAMGVDFYHFVAFGMRRLALTFGKVFVGARGSGIRRDLRHLAEMLRPLVACSACRGTVASEMACVQSRLCEGCQYEPPTGDSEGVDRVCADCARKGYKSADPRYRPCARSVRSRSSTLWSKLR